MLDSFCKEVLHTAKANKKCLLLLEKLYGSSKENDKTDKLVETRCNEFVFC